VTPECLSKMCLRLLMVKTMNVRFIAHKFSSGWTVGMVKSAEKKKSVQQGVAGQFAVKD